MFARINWELSENIHMALSDAIKAAREAKKMTQAQLGAHFGISKSAVNLWEAGTNVPDQRKLAKLVEVLDLDPSVAVGMPNHLDAPTLPMDLPVTRPRAPAPQHSAQQMTDRPDVPVWASIAAGDGDGAMILSDDPIDFIRRSETMIGVKKPFAFYIVGDSMEDRLTQGDMGVVNTSLPLRPGDDCVFIHDAEDGTMYGLVKRLLRSNADHWRVRQLNPRKDFDLSKKKWSRCYRIVEIRPR